MRRFAIFEPFLVQIGKGNRANCGAVATANALGHINVARPAAQGDAEVPGLAVHVEHVRIGEQFDVQVAARVHQSGADAAHGAIIGGEGLVQLRHVPADS